jgi:hypothetical protein
MSKYSTYNNPANLSRNILGSVEANPSTVTHEGGAGYSRTPKGELFLQAVTEMAENKFYESASERQTRMTKNIGIVLSEPDGWSWICNLVTWLRKEAGMRSASIMIAAEAVAAQNGLQKGGLSPRQLVAVACQRADEPAEFLGYWLQFKGRKLPAAVKRGVADAAVRLYNEYTALKYDGQSRSIRMGDVIELTHPKPSAPWQASLFKYLIDNRHNRDVLDLSLLPKISMDKELLALPENKRKDAFATGLTSEAGWSWERVAGWVPGGLTAKVWEGIIPTMGYMATLRILRNFEQAGISAKAKKAVNTKLSDREQVAKSLQFPYRFFSAWKNTESLEWASSLEVAANLSVNNIPEFEGRTLVLIDTSGSMSWSSVGGERSKILCSDAAALFGCALANRNAGRVDLVQFATTSADIAVSKGASLLRFVEDVTRNTGRCGGGTNTWAAIKKHYNGHDRIIVLTDEQSHDSGKNPGAFMHFVNLAGYASSTAPKDPRTFAYGGFTDAMFSTMPLLERGVSQRWPWEK